LDLFGICRKLSPEVGMASRSASLAGAEPLTAPWATAEAPDTEPEVLIVGAGPVGLFAALLLVERGIRVVIVDQERRPAARSYALALHPASLRLLDQVGLAADLLERAQKIDSLAFYGEGRRRAALDLSSLSTDFPCLAVLSQQDLESALERRLEDAGGRVLWNHRVADMHLGGGAAVATIERLERLGTGEDAPTAVADAYIVRPEHVLGADGFHSVVRHALQASWIEISPAELFAVFEVAVDGDPGSEARVILDEGATSVLWPLGMHRARWSFQIDDWPGFEEPRFKSRRLPQVADEPFPYLVRGRLEKLIAERAPWFSLDMGEVIWSMTVRFEHRLAGRFGRENAWLAGDSAHLASPVGAQSMNLGLKEAWDLARAFDGVLREDAPLELLERCEAEHRNEWRRLLGARGKPSCGPATDPWVRKHAACLIPCLPASGADLDLLLRQLGLALTGGQ
jgi:2-polyprenyl-6-methoxyphenol hydroxylase-like FAD-dependent oxidoreductase